MTAANRIYKTTIVCILICTFNHKAADAQADDTISIRWQKYIDLKKYSQPFWKADTIVDETVQVIKENDLLTGKLLFKAKAILAGGAAGGGGGGAGGRGGGGGDGQL